MTAKIKTITLDALLAEFDVSVHSQIRAMAAREGVSDLVIFECLDLASPQCGQKTAIAVGPRCTYQHVYQVKGKHLGDLPSQRQYPTASAPAKPG